MSKAVRPLSVSLPRMNWKRVGLGCGVGCFIVFALLAGAGIAAKLFVDKNAPSVVDE